MLTSNVSPATRKCQRSGLCHNLREPLLFYTHLLLFLLILIANHAQADLIPDSIPRITYRVVASYPHDPQAFTQGLVLINGQLYESTGQYGRSTVRRVHLQSGQIEQSIPLTAKLFGEGLMFWRGRLIQLTWRERLGIIYNAQTFEQLATFSYQGEGWGLTHDEQHWILSDGTDQLRFLDPETQRVVRRLSIHADSRPMRWLNELEYIKGAIWANVWRSDDILRIAPDTGAVTGVLNMAALYPLNQRTSAEAVLNGIAYDAASGQLLITGKYWPRLYAILIKE